MIERERLCFTRRVERYRDAPLAAAARNGRGVRVGLEVRRRRAQTAGTRPVGVRLEEQHRAVVRVRRRARRGTHKQQLLSSLVFACGQNCEVRVTAVGATEFHETLRLGLLRSSYTPDRRVTRRLARVAGTAAVVRSKWRGRDSRRWWRGAAQLKLRLGGDRNGGKCAVR